MNEIDPRHQLPDLFLIDGASNDQTASAMLCVIFSCAMCFPGVEYVLSLLSSFQIPNSFQSRQVEFYFVSNWLCEQSSCQICVSSCCILQCKEDWALTRYRNLLCNILYAMHFRLCKPSLKFTMCIHKFAPLSNNQSVKAAINGIEDEGFWKAIYCLLAVVSPILNADCCCNLNVLSMNRIYYLVIQCNMLFYVCKNS